MGVLNKLFMFILLREPGPLPPVPHPAADVPAPTQQDGTQELPVTPEIQAALIHYWPKRLRWLGTRWAIFLGIFSLLGPFLSLTEKLSAKGFLIVESAVLGWGVIICCFGALFERRGLRLDLHEPTYLRTCGPVSVVRRSRGGPLIRLIDRSFRLTPSDVADSLDGVDWASVDHTRNAHVILEIRRRDGRPIWGLNWWAP